MGYLTIDGKLLKVDGKYVTVSESSGASGEPQTKVVTPTKSQQLITADSGYYLSSVTVNPIPEEYIIPTGDLSITENGTHTVTEYSTVTVNVPTLDTSDATATPDDIVSGKTAYVNSEKITGKLTTSTPTLQTKVVTPTKSVQDITADSGYDGLSKVRVSPVTSSIDDNIVAENIKSGVTILGVTGTATGSSGGGSGSNATLSFDVATATLTITEG